MTRGHSVLKSLQARRVIFGGWGWGKREEMSGGELGMDLPKECGIQLISVAQRNSGS